MILLDSTPANHSTTHWCTQTHIYYPTNHPLIHISIYLYICLPHLLIEAIINSPIHPSTHSFILPSKYITNRILFIIPSTYLSVHTLFIDPFSHPVIYIPWIKNTYMLRWLISCVEMAKPWYPDIWSNTSLDAAVKVIFR